MQGGSKDGRGGGTDAGWATRRSLMQGPPGTRSCQSRRARANQTAQVAVVNEDKPGKSLAHHCPLLHLFACQPTSDALVQDRKLLRVDLQDVKSYDATLHSSLILNPSEYLPLVRASGCLHGVV